MSPVCSWLEGQRVSGFNELKISLLWQILLSWANAFSFCPCYSHSHLIWNDTYSYHRYNTAVCLGLVSFCIVAWYPYPVLHKDTNVNMTLAQIKADASCLYLNIIPVLLWWYCLSSLHIQTWEWNLLRSCAMLCSRHLTVYLSIGVRSGVFCARLREHAEYFRGHRYPAMLHWTAVVRGCQGIISVMSIFCDFKNFKKREAAV